MEREKPASDFHIHNLLAGYNFLSLLKPVHRIFKKAKFILIIDHKRSFVHPCLPLMTEFHGPDILLLFSSTFTLGSNRRAKQVQKFSPLVYTTQLSTSLRVFTHCHNL